MSKLDRHTVLVDEEMPAFLKPLKARKAVSKEAANFASQKNDGKNTPHCSPSSSLRKNVPVKITDNNPQSKLVPVLAGSPWKHYKKKYCVEHWCLFAIATSNTSRKNLHMIRSAPSLSDEKIQTIRQICHPNVADITEIYSHEDGNHFIVSQMMQSSLVHVYRAPEYPSESQLSSILFKVRKYRL
ncbi:kinase-like domain-containing protein [Fusarium mexicanum]|uniref:Kinase-like domain-containing protein n=1 Tax=Fusarium mexicanum TaxID=751941 RepID=A0A8H5N8U7_9HYPO|nr:kinase-like domain-containing protein [Fusarium mexicanum]